jgi:hypothetical protein
VGSVGASSTEEPFLSGAEPTGNVWYEVTALNPNGVAGPVSAPFRFAERTLDDNLNDFSAVYMHSASVIITSGGNATLYADDLSRADFPAARSAESVIWKAPDAQSFEALTYFSAGYDGSFQFLVSKNGYNWISVPGSEIQVNREASASGNDWEADIDTIDNLQSILPGVNYVQVERAPVVNGTAEVGEVRINYGS